MLMRRRGLQLVRERRDSRPAKDREYLGVWFGWPIAVLRRKGQRPEFFGLTRDGKGFHARELVDLLTVLGVAEVA